MNNKGKCGVTGKTNNNTGKAKIITNTKTNKEKPRVTGKINNNTTIKTNTNNTNTNNANTLNPNTLNSISTNTCNPNWSYATMSKAGGWKAGLDTIKERSLVVFLFVLAANNKVFFCIITRCFWHSNNVPPGNNV